MGTAAYEWSRIGGHLALDLCNTVSWRLAAARRTERLTDPATMIDWYCAAGGHAGRAGLEADAAADPHRSAAALRGVLELRDATTRLIDAHLDAGPGRDDDRGTVVAAWRSALAVAQVPPALPLRASVEPTSVSMLPARLALAVADLLTGPDVDVLRRCAGDGCGWLFRDTTRNHSRRWCDPLDCGNRARVRAYARRRRSTA